MTNNFITPDGTYVVLGLPYPKRVVAHPQITPIHIRLAEALRTLGAIAFVSEVVKKPKHAALDAINAAVFWDGPKTQFIVVAIEPTKRCARAVDIIERLCKQRGQQIRVLNTFSEARKFLTTIEALTTPEPTVEEKHQAVLDRLKIDGLEAWACVDDPDADAAMLWKFPTLDTHSAWHSGHAIYAPESNPSDQRVLHVHNASILLGREIKPGWQR